MTAHPTKVLFLAWGHSIHAQRRIQLFCTDPAFDVAVVSTYNYRFQNARNYLLTAARSTGNEVLNRGGETATMPHAATVDSPPLTTASQTGFFKKTYRSATALPVVGKPLHEAVTTARDYRILRQAVAEFKPEVIFLQTVLYPCYLALLLPATIPSMITFWNGDVVWWAKRTGAERIFKKQIVTQAVRRAAAMTVNSQAAFDACLAYGAPKDRVRLIRYPGVDAEKFRPGARAEAKEKLGLGQHPVILAPRGPVSYQNLDIIVEAAPAILANNPHTKFVFLAPGVTDSQAAFAEYRALAKKHNVDHAMVWRGNVPHDELPVLYQASDAVISISSEDSLPNCMLEAMATRVPLVMGDIPPIREWIHNGETGLLVNPRAPKELAAAVVRILQNPDKLVDHLTERAFSAVMAHAAGQTQIPLVKQLVHDVARQAS